MVFRFKQFEVAQDKSAMKISTDACILGAYAPVEHTKNILDIGTGTGLLSLMCAQRARKANLVAIEVEKESFEQAKTNFKNSPFSSRISIYHTAIQDFGQDIAQSLKKNSFDFIICNPPFFQKDLGSRDKKRHLARHSESLSFDDLLSSISKWLHPNGHASILLPFKEMDIFLKKAVEYQLYPQKKLVICSHKGKAIFRVITTFSKVCLPSYPAEKLVIYKEKLSHRNNQNYTDGFAHLLRNYFLIFE